MGTGEFWSGAALIVLLVIILAVIVACNVAEERTEECKNAGYVDYVVDGTAFYCYRVEGNDLIGRSLEAIRVEGRGQ